jgi:hypothetical protein
MREGLATVGARGQQGKGNRLGVAVATSLVLAIGVGLTHAGAEARAQAEEPPDTAITSGPSETYRLGSADFEFTSTDPAASFECSLDSAGFEPCDAASTFHVANGSHELLVRALDGAGSPDPTPARWQWWADALVQNGNFEASSKGWSVQGYTLPAWKPINASISRVNGGIAGQGALKVQASGNATMSAYSSPFPIDSAVAGDTYSLSGQVRSSQPGEKVCLRVRERSGSSIIAVKQACRTATGSWAEFAPISLTVARSGSQLTVDVYQASASSTGEAFEVDGIELRDGSSPEVPPLPAAPDDPTLLAAADVASCWSSGDEAVSRLLDTMSGPIAIPGDTEQNKGSSDEFAGCYDPSWGRHRSRTLPAVGDHEYRTAGAAPYFDYFGSAAGGAGKGWYSYDLGAWHIIVLNSNCANVGGCGAGSEQYEWLRKDLEDNGGDCIGTYWHHPLFSAGALHGGLTRSKPFWNLLYEHGAEWVLSGNDHAYQRFAPQTPAGSLDPAGGMRQFVIGTGGTRLDPLGAPLPNTQVQDNTAFGVLRLGLHEGSYDWEFVPQAGKTFTDSGSTACSALPPETTLESGPSGTVTSDSAAFTFSADQPDAEFLCSLDDEPFSACSSPKEYTGLTDGEHVFRVQAVDPEGNVDATPASRTWTVAANDLIANGSFEGSLNGWVGFQAVLSLISGGPEGESFARVAPDGNVSSYTVNTSPRPVKTSVPSARYQATGWFRSAAGNKVCLNVRERVTGSPAKTTTACTKKASGTWERFSTVTHSATGGGSIEVFASGSSGQHFDVDGLSLLALP